MTFVLDNANPKAVPSAPIVIYAQPVPASAAPIKPSQRSLSSHSKRAFFQTIQLICKNEASAATHEGLLGRLRGRLRQINVKQF